MAYHEFTASRLGSSTKPWWNYRDTFATQFDLEVIRDELEKLYKACTVVAFGEALENRIKRINEVGQKAKLAVEEILKRGESGFQDVANASSSTGHDTASIKSSTSPASFCAASQPSTQSRET